MELKLILQFIMALPQLLKLIENLQKIQAESEEKREIKKDIEQINKAFEAKDAESLRAIFNNTKRE